MVYNKWRRIPLFKLYFKSLPIKSILGSSLNDYKEPKEKGVFLCT